MRCYMECNTGLTYRMKHIFILKGGVQGSVHNRIEMEAVRVGREA